MPTKLKHRWSLTSYLNGIKLDQWLELLANNHVSPAYWHRAAFITLTAAINSFTSRKEQLLDEAIQNTPVHPSPVFILGHWRSGTTHLHNLIARDKRFAFPNTYQVINPHTFLTTEETNTRRYAKLVPKTRPMDEVAMGFDEPQEDEFAPCMMSLLSLYLGISFPNKLPHYETYLTFEHATQQERDQWKQALLWFCRKLTYKNGYRPLVLKSPPHTARIRLLLEIFPDARFVHIHRHPHDVFRSNRHYWDTAVWFTYLQKPDLSTIDDGIIRRYRLMHDAFHQQRPLIPEGNFHELSFHQLETDPINSLAQIYQALDLPDFEKFLPDLNTYLNTLGGYRKNKFQPVEPAIAEKLANHWAKEFSSWKYDPSCASPIP